MPRHDDEAPTRAKAKARLAPWLSHQGRNSFRAVEQFRHARPHGFDRKDAMGLPLLIHIEPLLSLSSPNVNPY